MEANVKRIMGLDMGDSRIGVALSDPLGIMASPLTIISRKDEEADIKAIIEIIEQKEVRHIIIGLPLSMDGSLGKQAEKVQAFAEVLGQRINIPIEFIDERLSTVAAKRIVQGVRKTNKETRYDAAAAALILQCYLDDIVQMKEYRDRLDYKL